MSERYDMGRQVAERAEQVVAAEAARRAAEQSVKQTVPKYVGDLACAAY